MKGFFASTSIRVFFVLLLLPITNTQSAFCPVFAAGPPIKLEWYADLYPVNDDYIRVMIDTRGLPVNTVVRVGSIGITCNSAKRSENRTFTPADFGKQFSELRAGKKYEGYFRHSCIHARSVTGKRMQYHVSTLGLKGGPSRKLSSWSKQASKKSLNVTNADIIVLSDVPASKPSHKN